MKSLLFAAALLASGAALAQDQTVPAGNQAPERDARGIPVVSDAANAPAGANRVVVVPPGAQVVFQPSQPVFAPTQPTEAAPPCTRERTDRCVQTYERGSRAPN